MRIGELTSVMSRMSASQANWNRMAAVSTQRLSTGKRVNSAADDPSAIGRIQRFKSQINDLRIGKQSAQEGLDALKTLSSAMTTARGLGSKLSDLASAYKENVNDTAAKASITKDAKSVLDELANTFANTEHNGVPVFGNSMTIKTGVGGDLTIDSPKFSVAKNDDGTYNITKSDGTQLANQSVEQILNDVDVKKEIVGGMDREIASLAVREDILERRITMSDKQTEIHSQALSRLEDADIAEETMNLAKSQMMASLNAQLMAGYTNQMQNQLAQIFSVRI